MTVVGRCPLRCHHHTFPFKIQILHKSVGKMFSFKLQLFNDEICSTSLLMVDVVAVAVVVVIGIDGIVV